LFRLVESVCITSILENMQRWVFVVMLNDSKSRLSQLRFRMDLEDFRLSY